MLDRMILNDIKTSKGVSAAITGCIMVSSLLIILAVLLTVNVTGAIEALMEKAKTPHFMQMHSGSLQKDYLELFAARRPEVEEFQLIEFLNLDGDEFVFESGSLASNVQDNGIAVQGELFDFLIDLDGNKAQAENGFVYVPLCYYKEGKAKAGEKLIIAGRPFTIKGFIRDSQMNSLLSSSKRFLVSTDDFAALYTKGSVECLIEFRLLSLDDIPAFEQEYTSASLPSDGPTLTWALFKMINAVSDGLLIFILLLCAFVFTAISLLCIRFTIIAKIEEDYREIGTLKALGISISSMKKMYKAKYTGLAVIGIAAAVLLSIPVKEPFLENIRMFTGHRVQGFSVYASISAAFALMLLLVSGYVGYVLNRFKTISPARAVQFGFSPDDKSGARWFQLAKFRTIHTQLFLGIKEVLSQKKLYATLFFIYVFCTFLLVVPFNLYTTIDHSSFITYMGLGECDMRIDIPQAAMTDNKSTLIINELSKDLLVEQFALLETRSFYVKDSGNNSFTVKVETGDQSVFPIQYAQGEAPKKDDEIALSVLLAEEQSLQTGDDLIIFDGEIERPMKVCGIYSDITNGGKTAKAVFMPFHGKPLWKVIAVSIKEGYAGVVVEKYTELFPFAKVSGIDSYIQQTFGGTKNAIEQAALGSAAAVFIIIMLVTWLSLRLLVGKETHSLAIMKAIGFTADELTCQYIVRVSIIVLLSLSAGLLLSNTLGELLAGALLRSFGSAAFSFKQNIFFAFTAAPLIILVPSLGSALLIKTKIRSITTAQSIRV